MCSTCVSAHKSWILRCYELARLALPLQHVCRSAHVDDSTTASPAARRLWLAPCRRLRPRGAGEEDRAGPLAAAACKGSIAAPRQADTGRQNGAKSVRRASQSKARTCSRGAVARGGASDAPHPPCLALIKSRGRRGRAAAEAAMATCKPPMDSWPPSASSWPGARGCQSPAGLAAAGEHVNLRARLLHGLAAGLDAACSYMTRRRSPEPSGMTWRGAWRLARHQAS